MLGGEHKRDPFDVLHAYFLPQAGFVATLAGNYLVVLSVVSALGNDLERAIFDPGRAAHILYSLQNANAVTTNANALAKKARTLVPGLDVTVIPNGIDTEHFRPLPRNNALAESLSVINEEPIGEPSFVIGSAGELRVKKGLRPLLSAYTQVNEKFAATLLIVGDIRAGEDKQIFQEFNQLHPDKQLTVTGFVSPSDLPAHYSLMDVFVQLSLRDGLPNALLEAMACEKTVIATPVGWIADTVTDCENGRLVSTDNADELANTIIELLTNEHERRTLGGAARQAIMQRFTLQGEFDGNLAIYHRLGLKV